MLISLLGLVHTLRVLLLPGTCIIQQDKSSVDLQKYKPNDSVVSAAQRFNPEPASGRHASAGSRRVTCGIHCMLVGPKNENQYEFPVCQQCLTVVRKGAFAEHKKIGCKGK